MLTLDELHGLRKRRLEEATLDLEKIRTVARGLGDALHVPRWELLTRYSLKIGTITVDLYEGTSSWLPKICKYNQVSTLNVFDGGRQVCRHVLDLTDADYPDNFIVPGPWIERITKHYEMAARVEDTEKAAVEEQERLRLAEMLQVELESVL